MLLLLRHVNFALKTTNAHVELHNTNVLHVGLAKKPCLVVKTETHVTYLFTFASTITCLFFSLCVCVRVCVYGTDKNVPHIADMKRFCLSKN